MVFGNPIPKSKQDKKLADTILREEAEGVLAWMAEGERLRQLEGLGDAPRSFATEKEKWRKKMDVIQQFLDERYQLRIGLREPADAVYKDYVDWIGNPKYAMTRRTLTQHLAKLGITLDKGRRYYEGLERIGENAETDASKT